MLKGGSLSTVKTNLRTASEAKPAPGSVATSDSIKAALEPPAGGWASDFEKDVMDMVMGLSNNGLAATPFGSSVQKIMDLIEHEMMPKVVEAHGIDQEEVNKLADTLKQCGVIK